MLETARKAGIDIPTLCYLKEINKIGACRVCLVEIEKTRGLQAACVYPVTEGLVVKTNTPLVREARKAVVELILSNHPMECLTCSRSTNCELQALARKLGSPKSVFRGKTPYFRKTFPPPLKGYRTNAFLPPLRLRLQSGTGGRVLGVTERGFDSIVAPPFHRELGEVNCVLCGQCVNVCPVGALKEKSHTGLVLSHQ